MRRDRMPRSIEEGKREELASIGLEIAARELMALGGGDIRDGTVAKALFYGIAAMIRRETLNR